MQAAGTTTSPPSGQTKSGELENGVPAFSIPPLIFVARHELRWSGRLFFRLQQSGQRCEKPGDGGEGCRDQAADHSCRPGASPVTGQAGGQGNAQGPAG